MFFSENFQPKDQIDEFDIKNRLEIIFLSDCFFLNIKLMFFNVIFLFNMCYLITRDSRFVHIMFESKTQLNRALSSNARDFIVASECNNSYLNIFFNSLF